MQDKSTVVTSLESSVEIWCNIDSSFSQARIGREIHFVSPHILDSNSQAPSWEWEYSLRLNYSEDQKTWNHLNSGILGIPTHSIWVRHRLLRNLGNGEFWLWRHNDQWLLSPLWWGESPIISGSPQRLGGHSQNPCQWILWTPELPLLLQCGSEGSEPWSSRLHCFSSLLPPTEQALRALRTAIPDPAPQKAESWVPLFIFLHCRSQGSIYSPILSYTVWGYP
jgi:hypothetical protein